MHNIIGNPEEGVFKEVGNGNVYAEKDNQYSFGFLGSLSSWQPGRVKQLDFLTTENGAGLSGAAKPAAITLGIGGNDAGFGDVIKACSTPNTCSQAIIGSAESDRLALTIASLKPRLIDTYNTVKKTSPQSRIYVHGYPRFVTPGGDCALNVPFDTAEISLIDRGVRYMNQTVKAAAQESGVYYVDVENILDGVNLCNGDNEVTRAFNGLTTGNDIDFKICRPINGCFGNESFHPNHLGHEGYAVEVMAQTEKLTKAMPQPVKKEFPVPDYFGLAASTIVSSLNDGTFTGIIPEYGALIESVDTNSITIRWSGLEPDTQVIIQLHSKPITIGSTTVNSDGTVSLVVELPENTEPGAHQIHLTGIDTAGEVVQIYEQIVVGQSENDFDGDGLNNDIDSCPTVINSSVDLDQDGIDDACDNDVVLLQVDVPANDSTQEDAESKGVPNRETVAGTDQELGINSGGVLGVSTDTTIGQKDQLLIASGTAGLKNLLAGVFVLISALLIQIKMNQKY
jgi:hypothetical protein